MDLHHETHAGRLAAAFELYLLSDAAAAIDWLCRAFGFEVRLKVEGEGGTIERGELTYGDGLIVVSQERAEARSGRGKH